MLFGITNVPADFQHFINDVLRPFLDVFYPAYIDNILIYRNTLSEHKDHVRQVLKALTTFGLHLKAEKCKVHQTEVKYLGVLIGVNGIGMDPSKIQTIKEEPELKNLKDIQCFLGFANFYHRFIEGYSQIMAPLIMLTKKNRRLSGELNKQQPLKS
jgi:hypothetical protein